MRQFLILFIFFSFIQSAVKAQTIPGPAEKKVVDFICACISRLDLNSLTSKESAEAAFQDCFSKQAGLLLQVTMERKVEFTDHAAMRELGIGIAKNLMAQNCEGFMKLSLAMVKKPVTEDNLTGVAQGRLKRIDAKEFNHFVVTDTENKESTFIWLRQFPGSDGFVSGPSKFIGKNIKIKWQEMEVFIPSAKNYYKIKEVVELEVVQ